MCIGSFGCALMRILRRHRFFWIAYGVCFLAAFLLHISVDRQTSFLWVNQRYNEAGDIFFRYITWLGDGKFYIILIVMSLLYRRYWFYVSLSAFLGVSLVVQVLKRWVYSDVFRPAKVIDPSLIRLPEFMDTDYLHSFPSGHTTVAFSIACAVSILAPTKKWAYVALFFAVLVAYSRMYLAKHWLFDVIIGSLIGMIGTLFIGILWQLYGGKDKHS